MQLCRVAVSWCVCLCKCVGACGVHMCVFVHVLVCERGQERGALGRV